MTDLSDLPEAEERRGYVERVYMKRELTTPIPSMANITVAKNRGSCSIDENNLTLSSDRTLLKM